MKVISWDVGIKNLAYCIINSNNNNEILEWNSINLIPETPKCFISSCNKKTVKYCKFYDKEIHWCEKHCNIYNKLLKFPNSSIYLTKPKNVKHINCNNYDINILRKNMIKLLDINILPHIFLYKIKYAIIENQPTLKNPRMKAIADTLYTWILIRGINDRKIIKSIHLISPSNKLKKYAGELINSENKYKKTKLKSIEVVSDYLNNHNKEKYDYLQLFKKKDDLCDALLQGFYWIDKFNIKK